MWAIFLFQLRVCVFELQKNQRWGAQFHRVRKDCYIHYLLYEAGYFVCQGLISR
jgi:hypothetical protein